MKILLIDDDQDILDVISELLDGDGHKVVKERNVSVAFSIYQDFKPDLVIMDYSVYNRDKLKSFFYRIHKEAVVMTTQSVDKISKDLDTKRVLKKPLDLDDLYKIVNIN